MILDSSGLLFNGKRRFKTYKENHAIKDSSTENLNGKTNYTVTEKMLDTNYHTFFIETDAKTLDEVTDIEYRVNFFETADNKHAEF